MANDFVKVSKHIHPSVREFGRAVISIRAEDEPHYADLQNIMNELSAQCPLHAPYDWENDYADVKAETSINQALDNAA